MRFLLNLLLGFIPTILFSQQTEDASSIEEPKYDTTISFDIKATNSFYFCSKLYKIPRDCNTNDPSNCCSFSSQVFTNHKFPVTGQLGCYNGTSLFWTSFETADQAKSMFEGFSPQIKKQMKKFKLISIKLLICEQEAPAYKLSYETHEGHKGYTIISYATINGEHIMLQLRSLKELKSSNDLQSIFKQIVQF